MLSSQWIGQHTVPTGSAFVMLAVTLLPFAVFYLLCSTRPLRAVLRYEDVLHVVWCIWTNHSVGKSQQIQCHLIIDGVR